MPSPCRVLKNKVILFHKKKISSLLLRRDFFVNCSKILLPNMKKNKNIIIVSIVLFILTMLVVLFPYFSDNQNTYGIVLLFAIGILIGLLFYLLWTNLFSPKS